MPRGHRQAVSGGGSALRGCTCKHLPGSALCKTSLVASVKSAGGLAVKGWRFWASPVSGSCAVFLGSFCSGWPVWPAKTILFSLAGLVIHLPLCQLLAQQERLQLCTLVHCYGQHFFAAQDAFGVELGFSGKTGPQKTGGVHESASFSGGAWPA